MNFIKEFRLEPTTHFRRLWPACKCMQGLNYVIHRCMYGLYELAEPGNKVVREAIVMGQDQVPAVYT